MMSRLCLSLMLINISNPLLAAQLCKDPTRQDQAISLATNSNTAGEQKARFITLDKWRVVDQQTGLEWQRCSIGLTGPHCEHGNVTRLSLPEAFTLLSKINRAGLAGYHDWRIPSTTELTSLINPDCINPAIDTTAFPGTPHSQFWSHTSKQDTYIYVDFGSGFIEQDDLNLRNAIRLVRQPTPATLQHSGTVPNTQPHTLIPSHAQTGQAHP